MLAMNYDWPVYSQKNIYNVAFQSSSYARLLSLFDVLLLPNFVLNAFEFTRTISVRAAVIWFVLFPSPSTEQQQWIDERKNGAKPPQCENRAHIEYIYIYTQRGREVERKRCGPIEFKIVCENKCNSFVVLLVPCAFHVLFDCTAFVYWWLLMDSGRNQNWFLVRVPTDFKKKIVSKFQPSPMERKYFHRIPDICV